MEIPPSYPSLFCCLCLLLPLLVRASSLTFILDYSFLSSKQGGVNYFYMTNVSSTLGRSGVGSAHPSLVYHPKSFEVVLGRILGITWVSFGHLHSKSRF